MTSIAEAPREYNDDEAFGWAAGRDSALDEIESLQQQIAEKDVGLNAATEIINSKEAEIESLQQQLAESQTKLTSESLAREKVLRDALMDAAENISDWGSYAGEYFQDKWKLKDDEEKAEAIATLPFDSTALDEAIRQAKREALLEAADEFDVDIHCHSLSYVAIQLRHMAGEL